MYRPITSRENSIFKQLRKLKRKKYRDRESRYLIEGENLICEALDNEECMEEIILREDVALKFEAIADETSVPVYTLPPELFDDVADTETCQGILAVVKKQIYNIMNEVPILNNNLWNLSKMLLHLCNNSKIDGFKFLGNEKDISNIDSLYQKELNLINGWLNND